MNHSENPFHPIKAVAIDLDGTLLAPDLSISAENIAAVEELHANGISIIIASGRHHISILPHARKLPQVEWIVSSQGAFTADLDCLTVLYDNHLPRDEAASIIETGQNSGYSIIVYARQGIFTLNEGEWIEYYRGLAGITPQLASKQEVLEEAIFKVVLLDSEERIDAALQIPEIRDWPRYKVRSLKNICEFAGLGTSKAKGLVPLLDHLQIPSSALATFGDAPNDVPMFEISGFSVAMDHAWEEAKAAARAIAPPGDPATSFARAVQLLKTTQLPT